MFGTAKINHSACKERLFKVSGVSVAGARRLRNLLKKEAAI